MEIQFDEEQNILDNTGFIKPKIIHFGKKRHWRITDGQFFSAVIRQDGQWSDIMPELPLEPQNQYFETYHCWIWNTLKAVEVMVKTLFNKDEDYSQRFNGVIGGATSNGGNPHNGCESIRNYGTCPRSILPWTPDLDTFYKFSAPRPASAMIMQYGQYGRQWLRQYVFTHDWVIWPSAGNKIKAWIDKVFKTKLSVVPAEALKQALMYSPVGVSVYAWQVDGQGLCYNTLNDPFNHWTLLVGYVDGKYWIVYDSYTSCWRKLRWNYIFGYAKRFGLYANNAAQVDANYITSHLMGKNVKGANSSGVYYIYNNTKYPYPSTDEFYAICDRFLNGDRTIQVVAQDSLDLIPVGNAMLLDDITSISPFNTISHT